MGSETFDSNSLFSSKNDENIKLSIGLNNQLLPVSDSLSRGVTLDEHKKNESNFGEPQNFYDEVDQQMSQNSLDYPKHQQQSNYVDLWLKNAPTPVAEGSDKYSPSIYGNIIGIRGINRPDAAQYSKEARKRHSPNYKKLEFDYLKLKSQYNELKGSIHGNILRFYKSHRKKNEEDLFVEKDDTRRRSSSADSNLIADHTSLLNKQLRLISVSHEQELKELREQVRRLESSSQVKGSDDENEVALLKKLSGENEKLRASLEHIGLEREKEVSLLKEQISKLTSEATGNKTLIKLRNENYQLRDLRELDGIELEALKEKYIRLEAQLSRLLGEQKQIEDEKSKEVSGLMVELCRLQVHLPKVELLLKTERAIKEEFQRKLGLVEGENEELRRELSHQNAIASQERIRAVRLEGAELDTMRQELEDWKEKCSRLMREKADADYLLEGARMNASALDARHQSKVDEAEDRHRAELEEWRKRVVSLEEQVSQLNGRNLRLTGQQEDNELERERLGGELSELGVKLDKLRNVERQVREQEKLAQDLREQLNERAMEARESGRRLRDTEMDLERHKEQVEDLRRRHECQMEAFEELKRRKDKEMSELRVKLNLERYNKQVAMESIEKELRVSLKELELMKYRFSRHLHQNLERPGKSSAKTSTKNDNNKQREGEPMVMDKARLISAPLRTSPPSPGKEAETSQ